MVWTQTPERLETFISLTEWREEDAGSWVVIVQPTLQGLVARAEMIEDMRPVCGACIVSLEGHNIIDVESTLEFGRWLYSAGRKTMMRVPLEASVLCLFDVLPLDALCIEPLWPHMGVERIDRNVLSWFVQKTNKHIVLQCRQEDLNPDDAEWLRNQGWTLNGAVQ